MWLDKLKELKATKGMTAKQIADKTKLPERTVVRLFSGETDNPYVDTLHRIVTALGGSLDDILADTKVVVATETLAEVKESADVITAERDRIAEENTRLKEQIADLKWQVASLTTERGLLELQLKHKDELLEMQRQHRNELERLAQFLRQDHTTHD